MARSISVHRDTCSSTIFSKPSQSLPLEASSCESSCSAGVTSVKQLSRGSVSRQLSRSNGGPSSRQHHMYSCVDLDGSYLQLVQSEMAVVGQVQRVQQYGHGPSASSSPRKQKENSMKQQLHGLPEPQSHKTETWNDSRETAAEVLRGNWKKLVDRLEPDMVIDDLYQGNIICRMGLEKIDAKDTRTLKCRCLLKMIITQSRSAIVDFCTILSRTTGISDLGMNLIGELAKSKCTQPLETWV